MLHMITNLMEAMKLKSNKISLSIVEVNLYNSINNLVQSKFKNDNSKEVIIHIDRDVMMFSDELRLLQIVENLLSNAIEYAKHTVVLSIVVDKESFILDISDDGEGFSNTDNVFNLFEQSDSDSLTRESQGVGTGLFIVKQLCDRMAYNIELLSSQELGGAKVLVQGERNIR